MPIHGAKKREATSAAAPRQVTMTPLVGRQGQQSRERVRGTQQAAHQGGGDAAFQKLSLPLYSQKRSLGAEPPEE